MTDSIISSNLTEQNSKNVKEVQSSKRNLSKISLRSKPELTFLKQLGTRRHSKAPARFKHHFFSSYITASLVSHMNLQFKSYELLDIQDPTFSENKDDDFQSRLLKPGHPHLNYENIDSNFFTGSSIEFKTDWKTKLHGTTQITKNFASKRFHKIAVSIASNENFEDILKFQCLYVQVLILTMHNRSIDNLNFCMSRYAETKKFLRKSIGCPLNSTIIAVPTSREPRIGSLSKRKEKLYLQAGQTIILTADRNFADKSSNRVIYVNCQSIIEDVKENYTIIIGNRVELKVIRQVNISAECIIVKSGYIRPNERVDFIDSNCNIELMTPEEAEDLDFIIKNDIKLVLVSGEEQKVAEDLREYFRGNGYRNFQILLHMYLNDLPNEMTAKFCSYIKCLASKYDGIVLSVYKYPPTKKQIISFNDMGKFVIETFFNAFKPILLADFFCSRDVIEQNVLVDEDSLKHFYIYPDKLIISSYQTSYNYMKAIYDLTDDQIHSINEYTFLLKERAIQSHTLKKSITDVFAEQVVNLSYQVNSSAIILVSKSGRMATKLSHLRPNCPIIVITSNVNLVKYLTVYHAIWIAIYIDSKKCKHSNWISILQKLMFGMFYALKVNIIRQCNDNIIFVYRNKRNSCPYQILLLKPEAGALKEIFNASKCCKNMN